MSEVEILGLRITLEEKAGGILGTSPDMRGLLVAGESRDDVISRVPAAIAGLLLAGGHERSLLDKMPDSSLLRMHDDIHKIMVVRAIDMKARHRAAIENSDGV